MASVFSPIQSAEKLLHHPCRSIHHKLYKANSGLFRMQVKDVKICVVGLGYVGLPLAVEFSKHFEVIGFDISKRRINELREHRDSTREVSEEALKQCKVNFTFNPEEIKECNFIV